MIYFNHVLDDYSCTFQTSRTVLSNLELYLFAIRMTGMIVDAKTRMKEMNRVKSASGGKTICLLKGVNE
jgi:hypothetical protein